MSDTWESTRSSINRLKAVLATADEDTRWAFGFWVAGIVVMASAIIIEFGWPGLLFCWGALLWRIAR